MFIALYCFEEFLLSIRRQHILRHCWFFSFQNTIIRNIDEIVFLNSKKNCHFHDEFQALIHHFREMIRKLVSFYQYFLPLRKHSLIVSISFASKHRQIPNIPNMANLGAVSLQLQLLSHTIIICTSILVKYFTKMSYLSGMCLNASYVV